MGSGIGAKGSIAILGWNLNSCEVVLNIACGETSAGVGQGKACEVDSLKVSKDGTSLYAVITSTTMSGTTITGSSSLKRWDIVSGAASGEVTVGDLQAGLGHGSGTMVGKLMQAKDGDSLYGVLTSSRMSGFRVAGAESVVQWRTNNFEQLRIFQIGVSGGGIGHASGMVVGDVKQTKDGRLLLVSLGRMVANGFSMGGDTTILKLDASSGQEVGRIPVGTSFGGVFKGQSVELTSLSVGKDCASVFGVVSQARGNISAVTVSSGIMQWNIETGALVKCIQTGMTFTRLGDGKQKQTTHEKLKQSKDGKSLYATVTDLQMQGFGAKGSTALIKWDVETGAEVARTVVGQSTISGINVQASDVT